MNRQVFAINETEDPQLAWSTGYYLRAEEHKH